MAQKRMMCAATFSLRRGQLKCLGIPLCSVIPGLRRSFSLLVGSPAFPLCSRDTLASGCAQDAAFAGTRYRATLDTKACPECIDSFLNILEVALIAGQRGSKKFVVRDVFHWGQV